MGTSSSFGGEINKNPLIPSWIKQESEEASKATNSTNIEEETSEKYPLKEESLNPYVTVNLRPIKTAFNKFARGSDSNRTSMKRAISKYIGQRMKGAKNLSKRMTPEKRAVANFGNILINAGTSGIRNAYPKFNITGLSTRYIFRLLLEEFASSSGDPDNSLIRNAYLATLQETQMIDEKELDQPKDEIRRIFISTFIANTIFGRIVLSIGKGLITLPSSVEFVSKKEEELKGFIKSIVEDAVTSEKAGLTIKKMNETIENIYAKALSVLESMDTSGE
jgi:hypothetical protein